MATEAQITANRRNAQASSGPRTAEGRARVSRNATTFGIYSAGDVIRPEEKHLYHLFREGFERDLSPLGAMETTLAAEIVHAAWRLRRCSDAESGMAESGIAEPARNAIDRARGQALRHFQRATAELRRLQTERQIRHETLPEDFDATTLGLASCRDMAPILKSDVRRQLLLHKLGQAETISAVTEAVYRPVPAPETPAAKQTQSPVARNSLCPCGSGAKYKRCCGTNAPPVLSAAA